MDLGINDNQQPATSNQQPATSNQQPVTPAIKNEKDESSCKGQT